MNVIIGRDFKIGMMTQNGKNIDLSTPEKLYDYLVKEMENIDEWYI